MSKVEPDQTDFQPEYEPGHPSADAKGYVKLPNVELAGRGAGHARGAAGLRGQPQRHRDGAHHGDAHLDLLKK